MGTAESISIHAASRPEAVAFSLGDREITYATLCSDLHSTAEALIALGVSPGSFVAVGVDDPYSHCLLMIALEQLGAGAASFSSAESHLLEPLFSRVDLVLAASTKGIAGARRLHVVTTDWLRDLLGSGRSALPLPRSHGDDPIRITRTSGTTGVTKILIVPRRQNDARLEHYAKTYGFNAGSRYLVTMALSVFPIYAAVMGCLRYGGTVVFPNQDSPMALTSTGHEITHAALTPLHLKLILDALPADNPKPKQLTIYAFGAGVSPELRARALDRLATLIFGSYGCNEAGFISIARPGDEGDSSTIWPGVDVEIVDENDLPLPNGAVGRIRVRSEFMVDGYLDDPDATRRMFRDGWFYPGDSGVIDVPGRLKLLGRTDDLLNVGGVKFAPEDLERMIAREPHVRDVGVCSLRNDLGIEEVCAAVVAADSGNDELKMSVLRYLPPHLGNIRVFRCDAIPRNEVGKILRDRLRDAVRRALRNAS